MLWTSGQHASMSTTSGSCTLASTGGRGGDPQPSNPQQGTSLGTCVTVVQSRGLLQSGDLMQSRDLLQPPHWLVQLTL